MSVILIMFVLTVICVLLIPFFIKCMFKFFMLCIICTVLFYGYAYIKQVCEIMDNHHAQIKYAIKDVVVNTIVDAGNTQYVPNDDGSSAYELYIDSEGNFTVPDFD